MNIVLVSYEYPPVTAIGGIGSYMYHLSVLLTGQGHVVAVFSADPHGKKLRRVERGHCVNFLVPATSSETFRELVVPAFEQFLQENRVDAIESPEVGACAWYIKQKFPHIPLIVKMHTPGVLITKISNTYLPLSSKLRFIAGALKRGKLDLGYWASHDKNRESDLEYKICTQADTLLSPSLALKHWASNFWNIPSQSIQVLANPFSVDDELFKLPLQNRPQVISFVGKLSVLKGMKALTNAIPLILKKNKNTKFFLVGRDDFENGKSMKEYMLERLGKYNADVVFTGALDERELKNIYAQSKVCVFPSLWENYPTVVMEAMAAGVAVVTSNVGGIPELVKHNKTGMLFHAKHPHEIAKMVNKLMSDESSRITMANAARNELLKQKNNNSFRNEQLRVFTKYKSIHN